MFDRVGEEVGLPERFDTKDKPHNTGVVDVGMHPDHTRDKIAGVVEWGGSCRNLGLPHVVILPTLHLFFNLSGATRDGGTEFVQKVGNQGLLPIRILGEPHVDEVLRH